MYFNVKLSVYCTCIKMENIVNRKEVVETTFKQIGIRATSKIAEHVLKENTYDNNLLTDISTVDYTKDNLGKTRLQPIENLGVFVDDLYIHGYLRKEDVVYTTKGVVQCTTGEKGSACYVLNSIRNLVHNTIGKNTMEGIHINFMHTLGLKFKEKGRIISTIEEIEETVDVLGAWKKYNSGEEPEAVFVVKVDASNIDISFLQQNIHNLETKLLGIGYYVYCVDYTRDFSGTMRREDLIEHFTSIHGFNIQGQTSTKNKYTILDNTKSVGNNVLTYIYTENNQTRRVKFYNKIVSNLEAGEVRSCIGGHIADYVYSSNARLRKVFYNPKVQERGVTRIDVSIYGTQKGIREEIGTEGIEEALCSVSKPIFYIQPAVNQWKALVEKIQKCTCVVDHTTNRIYMAWYGNTLTGRIVGVKGDFKKMDPVLLENYIQWFISDFSFRKVPIYRVEVLKTEEDKIYFGPLRAYVKNSNSYTYLTPCNRPTQIYIDAPDIEKFLPSTEEVEWKWRTKRVRTNKERKPTQEIEECTHLIQDKKYLYYP